MKTLIALLTLVSASTMAANVSFGYNAQNVEPAVKKFIVKTLKEKCSEAFSDKETAIVVTNVEADRIDQGMELEYVATVKVVEDYGHSPAQFITLEFDEDTYHNDGFYFYGVTATADYLCK